LSFGNGERKNSKIFLKNLKIFHFSKNFPENKNFFISPIPKKIIGIHFKQTILWTTHKILYFVNFDFGIVKKHQFRRFYMYVSTLEGHHQNNINSVKSQIPRIIKNSK